MMKKSWLKMLQDETRERDKKGRFIKTPENKKKTEWKLISKGGSWTPTQDLQKELKEIKGKPDKKGKPKDNAEGVAKLANLAMSLAKYEDQQKRYTQREEKRQYNALPTKEKRILALQKARAVRNSPTRRLARKVKVLVPRTGNINMWKAMRR